MARESVLAPLGERRVHPLGVAGDQCIRLALDPLTGRAVDQRLDGGREHDQRRKPSVERGDE
jgi:hypothetical protein